ncbi:SRPBCC family protein [Streptomyces sp. BV286]|uniref:SRPBCC family protein n=1 Tax=Streptomyces sp. BV286 TaxID=2849672 RepID=UPI001C2F09CF|nr:SRPBCC family protein [Streptomyces sp. BV286]MBV1941136.1 SRPBCC family protein [Streptomyces sp. BV286]
MHTVEETIEVAVPVRTAYNQWTQLKSFPRFMSVVRKVEQVRPALTTWTLAVGPLHREFQAEIVEQEPDSHMAWRSLGRSLPHRGEVSFRPTPADSTAVTVRIRIEARGATGSLSGRAPKLVGRVVQAELRHFKAYVEGLGEESGAWRGTIRDGRVRPEEPKPHRSRVARWPVG